MVFALGSFAPANNNSQLLLLPYCVSGTALNFYLLTPCSPWNACVRAWCGRQSLSDTNFEIPSLRAVTLRGGRQEAGLLDDNE